ncbi:unnamed protein product, partial [marine sediment metagenome]
ENVGPPIETNFKYFVVPTEIFKYLFVVPNRWHLL